MTWIYVLVKSCWDRQRIMLTPAFICACRRREHRLPYFESPDISGRVPCARSALRPHRPIKLMGYDQVVRGHVGSIARGINVANAQPNGQGLATVNPIFTWVRLAQRIPVRIHIDNVPDGVRLAAGLTATVQIDSPQGSGRFGDWMQMLKLEVAKRFYFR